MRRYTYGQRLSLQHWQPPPGTTCEDPTGSRKSKTLFWVKLHIWPDVVLVPRDEHGLRRRTEIIALSSETSCAMWQALYTDTSTSLRSLRPRFQNPLRTPDCGAQRSRICAANFLRKAQTPANLYSTCLNGSLRQESLPIRDPKSYILIRVSKPQKVVTQSKRRVSHPARPSPPWCRSGSACRNLASQHWVSHTGSLPHQTASLLPILALATSILRIRQATFHHHKRVAWLAIFSRQISCLSFVNCKASILHKALHMHRL